MLGLACVPLLYLFPEQAFPLVWVAPWCVLDGVAELRGRRPNVLALVSPTILVTRWSHN